MAKLALVVLTHADPAQLRRLLTALPEPDVFVHVDRKVPTDVMARFAEVASERVRLVERVDSRLGSWSLVRAELTGVAAALHDTTATHIAVISGADYPVAPYDTMLDALRDLGGNTYLENFSLPRRAWDTRWKRDGGLWRVEGRFLVADDQVRFVGRFPLRLPGRRRLPAGIVLRGGAQWKIYCRRHAEAVLEVDRLRPDVVAHWRGTLVPDETFVPSVPATPALAGGPVLDEQPVGPWFARWGRGTAAQHPHWLTTAEDAERIEVQQRSRAERGDPPILFARKFSSSTSGAALAVLDRLGGAGRGEATAPDGNTLS
jgi:hypothetical protein